MALIVGFLNTFIDKLYHYGLPFVVVMSVLIFVHEFGHYWVARRCGVRIDAFSIGFGPELFGWTNRAGTRWRVALIPMGGFVKMFGDADASSRPDAKAAAEMTADERRVSFIHKKLWQKSLVVGAGPAANFLFAIVILAAVFATVGQAFTPPVVGKIQPGSAAEAVGLQPDDEVVSIDGAAIHRFEELQQAVALKPGEPLTLDLMRNGQPISVVATPTVLVEKSSLGEEKRGVLGIFPKSGEIVVRHEDPATALWQATRETWSITTLTLDMVWQMATGRQSADNLAGPIGIGQMAGEIWREGFGQLVRFMALLSISLGLINLFPIPVLDGGHLLFYGIEAVMRRPVSERALAFGFRVGFALIVSFFVFVMWHDLTRLLHVTPGT